MKTLACVSWHLLRTLFKELRSPAIDFASLEIFPKNLTIADPLCLRGKNCISYNFDRTDDVFIVKNALTSYNLL